MRVGSGFFYGCPPRCCELRRNCISAEGDGSAAAFGDAAMATIVRCGAAMIGAPVLPPAGARIVLPLQSRHLTDPRSHRMKLTALLLAGIVAMAASPLSAADSKQPASALDFEVSTIDGETVDLEKYKGKVVLIVNVASKCGLTPQYEGLQALYEKYNDQGLVVLGFPCNQFRGQEPGSNEEIKQFCTTKYDVSFPLFSKIEVNGEGAAPLYKYLTAQDVEPVGSGEISWNFEKFLIDREGKVVARFAPRTKPEDAEVIKAIESELK